MDLMLEIPTPHIQEFLPLTDIPFGLAQLFLKDDYPGAEDYHKMYQGCLLDNGMYELDESLTVDQIIVAARVCNPVALIAPDWMDEIDKTLAACHEMLSKTADATSIAEGKLPFTPTVGGVVQGRNLDERLACLQLMTDADLEPICFPFRTPRDTTIAHAIIKDMLKPERWYHLLGLQDLAELRWYNLPGMWSIDTGKPFKNFDMSKLEIRGHGKLSLHGELGIPQRFRAHANIAYMRALMHKKEVKL